MRWTRPRCRSAGRSCSSPFAVNVGNPHVVFFVDDADAVDLDRLGPLIERDPLFPERVNVNVASIEDGAIRLRVWERGAGLTRACGTGACATAVAAIRRKLAPSPVEVRLPGGTLTIDWAPGETIRMSGPATHVFTGELAVMSGPEVITLGCRLNVAESEAMRAARARRGRSRHRQQLRGHQRGGAPDPPGDPQGEARAARRADRRHRLRRPDRARDASRRCPRSRACSATARSSMPSSFLARRTKVRVSDIMAVRETAPHLVAGFAERARAFVEVQNGCDHRCTFCIIPYGRGNSRSVPAGLVVERIKALVDEGFREVVLTGVDVTSYGPDLPARRRSASWSSASCATFPSCRGCACPRSTASRSTSGCSSSSPASRASCRTST